MKSCAWVIVMAALGAGASAAVGGFANEYAVFGNDSLTFLGYAKVSGGPAGSNGDVGHMGGSAYFDELRGGGALNRVPPTSWAAKQIVTGNIIFNQGVELAQFSSVGGTIHSGGPVTIRQSTPSSTFGNIVATGPVSILSYNTVNGTITSGGNVNLASGVNVSGNLGSNGNVALGIDSHVAGAVTHAGTFSMQSFSSVGSEAVGTVNPQPQAYTPAIMPPATTFTSGGADLDYKTFDSSSTTPLAPGSYGNLIFEGANHIYLTGGNYFFSSISSPGTFLDMYLDVTKGPINIFVTGNVEFKRVYAYVNGQDYKQADPALAASVLLESHGNINMTGNFFGSLFAPDGDIATGTIGSVTGSVVGGHNVTIGSSTSITDGAMTYVPSAYLAAAVPEPGTLGLLLAAGATLAARRRGRSGAADRR